MDLNQISNRFVIEDSVPKVTSDGEPHELLTFVAIIVGMIASIVVLFVLQKFLVNYKEAANSKNGLSNNINRSTSNKNLPSVIIDAEPENSESELQTIPTISAIVETEIVILTYNSNIQQEELPMSSTFPGITTIRC